METAILVNLAYIASSILFIVGLKMLGTPDTATRGNFLSSSGMLLAVLITLLDQNIIDYRYIAGALVAGSIVCLLYTSPSPRDATLSRMPSSA